MTRKDKSLVVMTLTASPGDKGPGRLDVYLSRQGTRFTRGFAERYNRASHDVDASGLTVEGDRLGGAGTKGHFSAIGQRRAAAMWVGEVTNLIAGTAAPGRELHRQTYETNATKGTTP